MEEWERDFKWLELRHFIKDNMSTHKLPDFEAILLLIGIQTLGRLQTQFSREEKQDLMHIATCVLMERDGYYKFNGRDEDGWPHYIKIKAYPTEDEEHKLNYLKEQMIQYFDNIIEDND